MYNICYRPISILPIVSKVLERHAKEIIDNHLAESSPISNNQWGFMHHRSSTSALISVIHDWLSALDSGHEVCVCLLYTSPSPRDATLSRMPSSA